MALQIKLDDTADSTQTQFVKVLLPRRETTGIAAGFKIVPIKKKVKQTDGTEVIEDVKKIVMDVKVGEHNLSAWYNPKVTKAKGTYRASELYKLLEVSKLLDKFKEFAISIKTEEQMVLFLEQYLKGKTLMFVPATFISKSDGKEYSGINEILEVK